ncbi:MAG TPA: hypothetical protein DHV38_09775 [Corynebacterium casei]|nr:hypothetical protein [Corynebacterium casei]
MLRVLTGHFPFFFLLFNAFLDIQIPHSKLRPRSPHTSLKWPRPLRAHRSPAPGELAFPGEREAHIGRDEAREGAAEKVAKSGPHRENQVRAAEVRVSKR